MGAVFDEQALMDRVDGDLEFLEETIEMLDEDGPDLLRQVEDAAAAKNIDALVKSAHALKGMLANFCAPAAEAAAREIEAMGREQCLDGLSPAIETLKQETTVLNEKLHAFLEANRE